LCYFACLAVARNDLICAAVAHSGECFTVGASFGTTAPVSNTKRPSVENGSVKFSDSDISVNGSGVLLVNLEGTDEKFGDSLVIDLANAASPVPAPSTFAPLVPV